MAELPEWAAHGRAAWTNRGERRPSFAQSPEVGQESVWDYPRPPALVSDPRSVRVEVGGRLIAKSTNTLRLLETSHPPTFYVPRADVDMSALERVGHGSRCEWKGTATYYSIRTPTRTIANAAWSYEEPFDYTQLAGHLAFYASLCDCFVGNQRARPQPGGFYGGWITDELVGPFKGAPGSVGW